MPFLFTKKPISTILKTTVQCLYYRYAVKSLKGFYLVICFVLLKSNPDLSLVTSWDYFQTKTKRWWINDLAFTLVSKPKKFYSVEKYIKCHIRSCFLTMDKFRKQIFKNILEWYEIPNSHFMIKLSGLY